jgi:hypothetical protein
MRKVVILVAAVAAMGLTAPAEATTTVKGHTRTDTTTCIEGDAVATVTQTFQRKGKDKWVVTRLTAKNPCPAGQWLVINSRIGERGTDNCCAITAVAGGVKFTWGKKQVAKYGHGWHITGGYSIGMDNELDPACEKEQGFTGSVVDENGKVWWGGAWRAADRCY